jgi:hypothetical protein
MQESYPLAERDPNISGRTSRASNLSAGSKNGGYHNGNIYRKNHALHGKSDILSAAPGVVGMLRTTTEIGDVGSLAFPTKKFGRPTNQTYNNYNGYNGPQRRSGTASRQSNGSASSQPMGRSSRHQGWPSFSSAGRRGSITSNITAPPFFDHGHPGSFSHRPGSPPIIMGSHSYSVTRDGGRSLSLTNAMSPTYGFSQNRSLTSLRSRVEPHRRPLSPGYRYPTRLKRPGFRPSSPALSDLSGVPPSKFCHQSGSRLKPGHGYPISQHGRHPAPYPANRNKSAPTVATIASNNSSGALRGHGVPVIPRDDTSSFLDQSMNQSLYRYTHRPKQSISYKPSMSLRTHSRSSTNPNVPSSLAPPSTPPTPPTLRMPIPVVPSHSTASINAAENLSKIPVYVDYTEDYNDLEREVTEVFSETMSDSSPMPLGFVERIRAILEQNNNSTATSSSSKATTPGASILETVPIPDIAELPAAPVGKRITREMILQALAPSSENLESSEPSSSFGEAIKPSTPESFRVEITPPAIEMIRPTDDDDRISMRSISQSVYSRPTNYTDPSEIPTRPVDEPPIPPMPSFDAPETSRKFELRKSMSFGSGMSGETVKHSFSTISAPAIQKPPLLTRDTTQTILERVKRCWSIRPSPTVTIPSKKDIVEEPSSRASASKCPSIRAETKQLLSTSDTTLLQPNKMRPVMETRHIPTYSLEVAEEVNTFACKKVPASPYSMEQIHDIRGSPVSPMTDTDHNYRSKFPPEGINVSVETPSAWMSRKQTFTNTFSITAIHNGLVKETIPENSKLERFNMVRAGHGPLPDVKEEPGLESNTDLRSTASTYMYPASRVSGPRSVKSRADRSSRDCESIVLSTKTHSVFKQASSNLAEAHAIPSLNFSCANLLSKLNEALGEAELPELLDSPQPERRPNSSLIREKYRSLFLSLEDMASNHEELAEFVSSQQLEILEQLAELEDLENDLDNNEDQDGDRIPTFRPLSADELIAEVNRLSIPSVTGLTYRLSELFPSLRRHFGEGTQSAEKTKEISEPNDPVEATIKDIRSLGNIDIEEKDIACIPSWRVSVATARTMPLSAEFVIDGLVNPRNKRVSFNEDRLRYSDPGHRVTERPFSDPPPGLFELPGSFPNVGRIRSFSDSEVDSSITDRMNRLTRPSHRSLRSPDADPCPWNSASSYPWSNSIPFIDIKFPQFPSPHQRTPGPNLSHCRLLSVSESASSEEDVTSVADETGGILKAEELILLGPTAGIRSAPPATTKHRTMKRSGLLESLSRKIKGPTPAAAASPAPPIPPSPVSKTAAPVSTKRPHSQVPSSARGNESVMLTGQGDNFVITNLSPPSTVLNIDDVHSFFSDDSSATARRRAHPIDSRRRTGYTSPSRTPRRAPGRVPRGHTGSLRKRLTGGLRFKGNKVTASAAATAAAAAQSRRQVDSFGTGESILQTSTSTYTPHPAMLRGPSTMTHNEFLAKRLVDRLKMLLWRSGELLRTVSGRRRFGKSGIEEGWSENGESFADLAVGALEEIGAPTLRGAGSSSRTTSLLTSP